MCVIIFHSCAQTKSCSRQTFALERNHTWDFLQHSGNGVKTLCFGEGSENSRFFEQTLAISFFKPSTLLAIDFKRHKSPKLFKLCWKFWKKCWFLFWFFHILVHIWVSRCDIQSNWWKGWTNWHSAAYRNAVSQWVSGLGDQSCAQSAGKNSMKNEKEGLFTFNLFWGKHETNRKLCRNFKLFLLSILIASFLIFLFWALLKDVILQLQILQKDFHRKITLRTKFILMSKPIH